ncbi:MAG: ABC-type transport system involved in cytochrome c biogenesis permease subunit [Cognaticolwellia sp.]
MHLALLLVALLAYCASAAFRIAKWGPRPWVGKVGLACAVLAVLAHVGAIAWVWVQGGRIPVSDSGDSVALISVGIGIGALLLQPKERGEVLAGVLSSLAAVLLGVGLLLPSASAETDAVLSNVFFPIHALATFVGISSFALSFGVSAVFLLVRWRLKRKRLRGLGGLPSMESLDQLNTRCVIVGFLSLTLGIAAGGGWASAHGSGGLGPVVWITLVLWVWYAVAVMLRVVGGWRGKVTAQLSVFGFVGMLVSLGSVLLFSQGWHP